MKSCLAGIKFLKNDFIKTNDGISGKNTGCTILHNKSWNTEMERFISAQDYNCFFISGPTEDNCNLSNNNTFIQLSD